MSININFFSFLLRDLIKHSQKKRIKTYSIEHFNICKNYIFAILWCFKIYKGEVCGNFDYITDVLIHPLDLLLYMNTSFSKDQPHIIEQLNGTHNQNKIN